MKTLIYFALIIFYILAGPAHAGSGPDSLHPKGSEDLPSDTCMAVSFALNARADEIQQGIDILEKRPNRTETAQKRLDQMKAQQAEARDVVTYMPQFHGDALPGVDLIQAAGKLQIDELLELSHHCLP